MKPDHVPSELARLGQERVRHHGDCRAAAQADDGGEAVRGGQLLSLVGGGCEGCRADDCSGAGAAEHGEPHRPDLPGRHAARLECAAGGHRLRQVGQRDSGHKADERRVRLRSEVGEHSNHQRLRDPVRQHAAPDDEGGSLAVRGVVHLGPQLVGEAGCRAALGNHGGDGDGVALLGLEGEEGVCAREEEGGWPLVQRGGRAARLASVGEVGPRV
mmetsp:Transcript_49161/g.151237  ORF Transcript_49161/g.151237 Transcript_49161/m.151237 type:complete len:215 (-) Transcript_49161:332-976(-)